MATLILARINYAGAEELVDFCPKRHISA